LPDFDYRLAIQLSRKIAEMVGTPRFYSDRSREVSLSRELFAAESLTSEAMRIVADRSPGLGHGLDHVEKVAIDGGALLLIEQGGGPLDSQVRRQVLMAHLAGLLHDIKRMEKDHASVGADEAGRILSSFPLLCEERLWVTEAIRNHEAFRPCGRAADPAAQLISDVLYDADKFRWGPDNFTETLWAMVAARDVPLRTLLPRFLPGLEGIRKIRDSFRTPAGRVYGPDFIDRGLAIGSQVYAALKVLE
jgi:hypothetical protein